MGCIPYYMFVERPTGAQEYFSVPLVRAWSLFRHAAKRVSGLARTVRGPTMSAHPGKVLLNGVLQVKNEKVFSLELIQARNPELVYRPFLARFDKNARWLTDLRPAFGATYFPYETAWSDGACLPSDALVGGARSRQGPGIRPRTELSGSIADLGPKTDT